MANENKKEIPIKSIIMVSLYFLLFTASILNYNYILPEKIASKVYREFLEDPSIIENRDYTLILKEDGKKNVFLNNDTTLENIRNTTEYCISTKNRLDINGDLIVFEMIALNNNKTESLNEIINSRIMVKKIQYKWKVTYIVIDEIYIVGSKKYLVTQ